MRRAFILALSLLPGLALAEVSATQGQVVERDHTNLTVTPQVSYINAAQCAGAPLNLEWFIQLQPNVAFTTLGTYNIFATNTQPTTTTGTTGTFCAEQNSPNANPQVFAAQIAAVGVTSQVQDDNTDAKGSDAVAGAGWIASPTTPCDPSLENKVVWICSHWVVNGTRQGAAVGKFIVQVQAPAAPTNLVVTSGDSALQVGWTASTGVQVDHYIVDVLAAGSTTPISSGQITATAMRFGGLTNGTNYTVTVTAFSKGGNPSAPSTAQAGTPMPVEDFWNWYKLEGGTDPGGCSSGAGGVLALAGVGALLLRRRKK